MAWDAYESAFFTCGILSLIGCTFCILSIAFLKRLRRFPTLLILYIFMADIVGVIMYLVRKFTDVDSTAVGDALTRGFLVYGYCSSAIWTGCLSHTLDRIISATPGAKSGAAAYMTKYHIISWTSPAPFVIIFLGWALRPGAPSGTLGNSSGPVVFLQVFAAIIFLVVWGYSIYGLVNISKTLKQSMAESSAYMTQSEHQERQSKRAAQKMLVFLFIYPICFALTAFSPIVQYGAPRAVASDYFKVQYCLQLLLGFLNSVSFGQRYVFPQVGESLSKMTKKFRGVI